MKPGVLECGVKKLKCRVEASSAKCVNLCLVAKFSPGCETYAGFILARNRDVLRLCIRT